MIIKAMHHILSLQFLRSGEELYIVHDIMFIKSKRSLIPGPHTNKILIVYNYVTQAVKTGR